MTLIVFDVLHLDDRALRALPYHRRRELLARTLPATGRGWRIPAPLSGALDAVLEVRCVNQLEGIVAKRFDAPYVPGRRSGAWLKQGRARPQPSAAWNAGVVAAASSGSNRCAANRRREHASKPPGEDAG